MRYASALMILISSGVLASPQSEDGAETYWCQIGSDKYVVKMYPNSVVKMTKNSQNIDVVEAGYRVDLMEGARFEIEVSNGKFEFNNPDAEAGPEGKHSLRFREYGARRIDGSLDLGTSGLCDK